MSKLVSGALVVAQVVLCVLFVADCFVLLAGVARGNEQSIDPAGGGSLIVILLLLALVRRLRVGKEY